MYPKLSLKLQDTIEYSDFIKRQHVTNLVLLADDLNSSDCFIAVFLNYSAVRVFESPLLH